MISTRKTKVVVQLLLLVVLGLGNATHIGEGHRQLDDSEPLQASSCDLVDLEACIRDEEGYRGCTILAKRVGDWCDGSQLGFDDICCGPVDDCCQLNYYGLAILIVSFLSLVSLVAMGCCACIPCCPLYPGLCIAQIDRCMARINQTRTANSPKAQHSVSTCKPAPQQQEYWEEPIKV